MYDILILTRIIPSEIEEKVRHRMKHTMDDAAFAWQNRLIKGIEINLGCKVKIINILPIKSWPFGYKTPFIHSFSFSHAPGALDLNVGFCNIQWIKRVFQKYPLNRAAKKWAKNNNGCKKIVIAYSLYPEFLDAVREIKKINPTIDSCAIVLDLPEYCILTDKISLTSNFYLRWSKKKSDNLLKYIDKSVFLTKEMPIALNYSKRSIIVEGMASEEFLHKAPKKTEDGLIKIIYAGTLHKRFGILNLLKAFRNIDCQNYRLIICGYGDSEKEIIDACKSDERIIFKGQISRQQTIDLLLSSNIIVNPRNNNEIFTKFSFPSKNLEALSSGIPFVGYKLDGISDEYDGYINYVSNVDELTKLLIEIGNDKSGYYLKKAELAKQWVFQNKNTKIQTNKIVDLITKQP